MARKKSQKRKSNSTKSQPTKQKTTGYSLSKQDYEAISQKEYSSSLISSHRSHVVLTKSYSFMDYRTKFSIAKSKVLQEYQTLITMSRYRTCWQVVEYDENLPLQMNLIISGPTSSPYSGGKFKLHFQMSAEYPEEPPKVYFVTKIWHPNVDIYDGSVYLDVLEKNNWHGSSVKTILLLILGLLTTPTVEKNPSAPAKQCVRDYIEYHQTAKLHTAFYSGIGNSSLSNFARAPLAFVNIMIERGFKIITVDGFVGWKYSKPKTKVESTVKKEFNSSRSVYIEKRVTSGPCKRSYMLSGFDDIYHGPITISQNVIKADSTNSSFFLPIQSSMSMTECLYLYYKSSTIRHLYLGYDQAYNEWPKIEYRFRFETARLASIFENSFNKSITSVETQLQSLSAGSLN